MGLLVEALTGGLAGHGRADPKEGWSATVFVEVWDPALFGGADAFARETGWLAQACRESAPRPGFDRVRLPGRAACGAARRSFATEWNCIPTRRRRCARGLRSSRSLSPRR